MYGKDAAQIRDALTMPHLLDYDIEKAANSALMEEEQGTKEGRAYWIGIMSGMIMARHRMTNWGAHTSDHRARLDVNATVEALLEEAGERRAHKRPAFIPATD